MNQLFQDKKIKKKYWAIVKECPQNIEGVLKNFLKKNQTKNKSFVVVKEEKNALLAELKYKLKKTLNSLYLLEINPRPGGSISLDEKSNANLILNYCRSFETFYDLKIPKEEVCYYKLDVKSTWSIPGDLLRYLSTNKNKRESI